MLTLTTMLARTERLYGARPAIIDVEGQFTWSEFINRIARCGHMLRRRGINAGDRFGLISRNSFRQAELMHAGYWTGAIPVPVNYRLAPREIAAIFEDADCKVIALEDFFCEFIEDKSLRWFADRALWLPSGDSGATHIDYESELANAAPIAMREAREDDDALLLYTGGTTGRSKGVRLSHRNIIANAFQLAYPIRPHHSDVYLHIPPMFHSADLLGTTHTMAGGAHAYLAQFTPQAALRCIEQHHATHAMLTPTMIIMTLQDAALASADLSSFRQLLYGSSPMAAEWIKKALDGFNGVEIVQAYGLTESSPILTILPMADHQAAIDNSDTARLRSVGRPIPGIEMNIIDDSGAVLSADQAGEIVVRGANVAVGYLNRPQETAAAFRDGWLHTGDIGRMDSEGYLYLLDRKKDMIITGGENVFSSEVEACLYRHPAVQECAVVGIPDETYGEALLAVIVPTPDTEVSSKTLISHCRSHIGGYKIPRRYEFVEELPKSAMNKVLKNELRRVYSTAGNSEATASVMTSPNNISPAQKD